MIRFESDEESKARVQKVQGLYTSTEREDQVVAILMDVKVSGHGDREDSAREKARAILGHLERPV